MPDEPDPPRKFYALGKAEFNRVNPAPEAAPAPAQAPDVHTILNDNLARANDAGLNELSPQVRRISARKRDYWTLFILGNGFFGGALLYFGLGSVPGGFALGGMIFFSAALTWVMWFVMGNY